jgi:hypothetical protein
MFTIGLPRDVEHLPIGLQGGHVVDDGRASFQTLAGDAHLVFDLREVPGCDMCSFVSQSGSQFSLTFSDQDQAAG